jgi:hypothetical protein
MPYRKKAKPPVIPRNNITQEMASASLLLPAQIDLAGIRIAKPAKAKALAGILSRILFIFVVILFPKSYLEASNLNKLSETAR